MKLTGSQVANAKAKEKPYKMADGGGLFLLVNPNGSRYWRMKYRWQGREKLLSIGVYPDVSLKLARAKRDEARRNLASEIDPSALKQAEKQAGRDSFEAVAREWFGKHSPNWAESHSSKVIGRLEKDVFPFMGKRPIAKITAQDLLQLLRRIESRGVVETAHRIRQHCSQVFRYAVATGRADHDPAAALIGALPPTKTKHFASIKEPTAIGELLHAIDGYQGSYITRAALQLAPLTFVRPGELRHAEWEEINFDTAEWRIAAHKMKMRAPHIVPLSDQAVTVLVDIQPVTGNGKYVFPSVSSRTRCMSENTVTAALRRMGYKGSEMTGHGFRSMASTLLNEKGWNRDAIERQLAHAERDEVRAAYNYAEYLPERREMMQAWADHLSELKREAVERLAKKN